MTQTTGDIEVVRAGTRDLDALAPLFDSYRQFYTQPGDADGARAFLGERLRAGDATIFLALIDGVPAGFTQLYPSFSSVRMRRLWILNDLFVAPSVRRGGVGAALLRHARAHAWDTGAARLTLQTACDNLTAQAAYEAEGWVRDDAFVTYTLDVLP